MRHIRPTKVVRAVVPAGLRPASGLLRAGWQADYQYDGMGNRTVMHYGGNSVGGQRRTVTCGADADNLNRYPSITFGSTTDVADVTGLADSQTAAEALRLNINGAGYTPARPGARRLLRFQDRIPVLFLCQQGFQAGFQSGQAQFQLPCGITIRWTMASWSCRPLRPSCSMTRMGT